MVAGLMVSCAVPVLVLSATDVATTVTFAGSPGATVGATYTPVVGLMVPPFGVVTAQVTAVLVVLVTVAIKVTLWSGHPSLALLGNKGDWAATLTPIGGELLPPQATRTPISRSATHRPAMAECFQTFRPAKPTMTMPASGKVNGSQGE